MAFVHLVFLFVLLVCLLFSFFFLLYRSFPLHKAFLDGLLLEALLLLLSFLFFLHLCVHEVIDELFRETKYVLSLLLETGTSVEDGTVHIQSKPLMHTCCELKQVFLLLDARLGAFLVQSLEINFGKNLLIEPSDDFIMSLNECNLIWIFSLNIGDLFCSLRLFRKRVLLAIEDGRLELTDDLLEATFWLCLLLLLCQVQNAIYNLFIWSIESRIGNLGDHWGENVIAHVGCDYLRMEEQLLQDAEGTTHCYLYMCILREVK